jgi:hypothetical protein
MYNPISWLDDIFAIKKKTLPREAHHIERF